MISRHAVGALADDYGSNSVSILSGGLRLLRSHVSHSGLPVAELRRIPSPNAGDFASLRASHPEVCNRSLGHFLLSEVSKQSGVGLSRNRLSLYRFSPNANRVSRISDAQELLLQADIYHLLAKRTRPESKTSSSTPKTTHLTLAGTALSKTTFVTRSSSTAEMLTTCGFSRRLSSDDTGQSHPTLFSGAYNGATVTVELRFILRIEE